MIKTRVEPVKKERARGSSVDSTALTHDGELITVRFKGKKHEWKWQIFNLIRRLTSIASACLYVYFSMTATWWGLHVLTGAHNPTDTLRVFTSSLIKDYMGDGLINNSPLVQNVLGGDTAPRDYILFLESATSTSIDGCSGLPLFNPAIYGYDFLIPRYEEMVSDTKYSVAALEDLELVVMIVDCSFSQLKNGAPSELRVYNLVRSRYNSSQLHLMTVSLSVQEYEIPAHSKKGPAIVGMLTVLDDMQDKNVTQYYMAALTYPYQRSLDFEMYKVVGPTDESFLALTSIPRNPETEPVKHLLTARKRGFYNGDNQCNVRTMYSILDGVNATNALTRWEWIGEAVAVDSWAWEHCIHSFFGLQMAYSLLVLFLVTYQKIRSGKVWLGDPFASISTTTLVMRGLLVLLSWTIDSFWSINEFAMSRGAFLSAAQPISIHMEIMHADLLVVYLSLASFLSSIFQERMDPSVATLMFEAVHQNRESIIRMSSTVLKKITTKYAAQYKIGIATVTPVLAEMSPDAPVVIVSVSPKGCQVSCRILHPDDFSHVLLHNFRYPAQNI
ncbi:unnamed protein product [Phytophthora fragariaefolia]|uniref:Unnamed protein product n=1 Tax=Phytophthora fragariaefolia TaxID=1490495 RepID=A0A9W7D996_9STRA|nr:unnamed protein product [Phytophthora fragariaefolia]